VCFKLSSLSALGIVTGNAEGRIEGVRLIIDETELTPGDQSGLSLAPEVIECNQAASHHHH
jgi:hypothetical protein